MKTKRRPEAERPGVALSAPRERLINMVGADAVLCEKVRASLRRGPFSFASSEEPLPPHGVALYVTAVDAVKELARTGVPVIAWGPASMLRAAYLLGCADYLRDPWEPVELAVRALAVAGREGAKEVFPWGSARFQGDFLELPGGSAALTHHEALILHALMRSRGSPVPRETLHLLAGGNPRAVVKRSVDAQVASVRRKVRAVVPEAGRFITCVRRQGYMLP